METSNVALSSSRLSTGPKNHFPLPKTLALICVITFMAGTLEASAAKPNKKERPLPGADIEIVHLDREPPEVEKAYSLPEVDVNSEPTTREGIAKYKQAIVGCQSLMKTYVRGCNEMERISKSPL